MPNLKGIALWSLFSLALMRGIDLIDIPPAILYLVLPGFVLFLYVIYFRFKTKIYLNFWRFLLSVTFISLVSYTVQFLIIKYIQLEFFEDELLRTMAKFVVSIIVASGFYGISLLILRIIRK